MFVEIARYLPDAGLAPRIFAPFHINEYLAELPASAFPIAPRIVTSRYPLAAARRMPVAVTRAMARIDRAKVVHETYYPASTPAPRGVPVVTTMYDMMHELDPSFRGDPVIGWKAQAIARADWITCISEHTRQDLIGLFPAAASKSSVVPLAGSLPDASASPRPQDRPYLLYVGERSRDYKNFRSLLEGYRTTPRLMQDFDLICSGGGPFRDRELEMIVESGLGDRVRQVATSNAELAALYAHAACFVYPSTYEGFGIPPLEAMGAGCPVVALARASMPEVCGEAVCYAEGPEPDALAHAVLKVAEDSAYADTLRVAGRERAAMFSWQRCAAQTAEVYRRLAR